MSRSHRDRALDELLEATRRPVNGEIKELDASIQGYERSYGLDTETLRRKIAANELRETDEICSWLMAAALRGQLVQVAAQSR